jgi:hypothetical protein
MRVFAVGLLVVMVTLAGCAGGGSKSEAPDDVVIVKPPAGKGKGVIVGLVLSEAVAPIAGATVTATPGDLTTTTNENGEFGFGDLEPGTYFLKATKPGHMPAQQSFDVVADLAQPPVVKLLLVYDAETAPRILELSFRGFLECSTTYVAACALPNAATDLLCGLSVCVGNLTNDKFIAYHEIEGPDPSLVQTELVWKSTQALSDRLWLWHSYARDDGTFAGSFEHTTGKSPLLLQTDLEEIDARAENAAFLNEAWQLVIRVFSGDIEGTTPPQCVVFCNGPGVSIQQEFEAFTYVFYNTLPPADWRFTQSGPPPQ